MISIGALGAGGTAAFGTEAFTSVEADRSVDVTVAGDESAFLAIQPLSGNNANEYVSTEGDDIVALDLDEGAGTDGSGVNQDAVTQVEDLFKIINQGTQQTSVFFEDDSNAVTFRVTDSDNGVTTEGEKGQSLEGKGKAVDINTGEQVAVGIEIDTLNNDVNVKDQLVDDVTIRAVAGSTEGDISGPSEFRTVVDESANLGTSPGFTSIQDAINGVNGQNDAATENIDTGGTILVEDGTFEEDVTIDVEGLTLEAADGASPTIAPGDNTDAITVTANNVAIDGFGTEIGVTDGEATAVDLSGLSSVDSVTIENTSFDADGAEGETYVFDPNGAVDLDAVEDANSFPGPAPVTGGVAINPNQPGDHTTAVGGMAVEQTDGTLTLLQNGDTLNFAADDTLLYVSDGDGTGVSAQSADRSRAFQFPVDDQGSVTAFGEVGETATAREGVDQLDDFSPIGDSDDVFESDSGEEIVVTNIDEERASEGLAIITLQE